MEKKSKILIISLAVIVTVGSIGFSQTITFDEINDFEKQIQDFAAADVVDIINTEDMVHEPKAETNDHTSGDWGGP